MLNLPDILMEKLVLSDLLESFQPIKVPDGIFSGMQLIPSSGSIDYLYLGAYSFLEEALDVGMLLCSFLFYAFVSYWYICRSGLLDHLLLAASTFSFTLASEVLLSMESVVTSVRKFLDKSLEEDGKGIRSEKTQGVLPIIRSRLGISARKLLRHNWNADSNENCWKRKVSPSQYNISRFSNNFDLNMGLAIFSIRHYVWQ